MNGFVFNAEVDRNMSESLRKLYQMGIHEEIAFSLPEGLVAVTRVASGWVYRWPGGGVTFVPYLSEAEDAPALLSPADRLQKAIVGVQTGRVAAAVFGEGADGFAVVSLQALKMIEHMDGVKIERC